MFIISNYAAVQFLVPKSVHFYVLEMHRKIAHSNNLKVDQNFEFTSENKLRREIEYICLRNICSRAKLQFWSIFKYFKCSKTLGQKYDDALPTRN